MKNVPVELLVHEDAAGLWYDREQWRRACRWFPLSSSPIIDLHDLRAIRGHLAPLSAIAGWIDSRGRPQRRGQGSASKASCPLPATWCSSWTKATFPFHSLHLPLPFYKQVKDIEWVELLAVISFSLLPDTHMGRGERERLVPSRKKKTHNQNPFDVKMCFWYNYGLIIHIPQHGGDLDFFCFLQSGR